MSSALFQAKIRVQDALDALDVIIQRLTPMTMATLADDLILIDACCYRICVVGEAITYAKNFQPAVFARIPVGGTTWDGLVHVRNQFIHSYNRATAQAVWMFFQNSQPIRLGLANVLGAL